MFDRPLQSLISPLLTAAARVLALQAQPGPFFTLVQIGLNAVAIMGGLIGAVAGASSGGDNRLGKAVVGGALGAALGGVIGATLDQQAADLRSSIGNQNISVVNNGSYLVVNMPQDVLFATGIANLRPDLTSDLGAVASNLINYPASRIEVIGHTDNEGSAALNQDLSQRRAASVANVLVGSGVPAGRIATLGRGEDAPVASNLSPQGRAQNRRVEIIIRPTA